MSVVLITGCSSGIGFETALAFSRAGFTTYASMRNPGKADALLKAAAEQGLTVEVLTLDVTDEASVTSAVRTVEERHGAVDVLINNAGVSHAGPVETIPMERAASVMDTNFWGPMRTARAVLPAMRAKGSGVIVNVNSVAGRVPGIPYNALYGASKNALSILTECLAWEVGPLGIRVVSVEPDFFATEIFDTGWVGTVDPAGPYSADHTWANDFILRSGEGSATSPAVAAEALLQVVLDPGTPLHVPVGEGAAAFVGAAQQTDSFESWLQTGTQIIESVAGPRPVSPRR